MAQYLRVVRRGKNNVRIELPDHTTKLVSAEELSLWTLVEVESEPQSTNEQTTIQSSTPQTASSKRSRSSSRPSYRSGQFRTNSNGLGIEHPYESVNMEYTKVLYSDGIESPF